MKDGKRNNGYNILKSKVGKRRFTIYDIFRYGTPPEEIRRLTALLQSLRCNGQARCIRKVPVSIKLPRNGKLVKVKKWVNQYMLL